MKIRITLKDGQEVVNQELNDFPVVIGRQAPAGIHLAFPGISGQHAEISVDGPRVFIRDLGSRNGTFVGDERINVKAITLPCKFRLGLNITVELDDAECRAKDEISPAYFKAHKSSEAIPAPVSSRHGMVSPPKRAISSRGSPGLSCQTPWDFFAEVKPFWFALATALSIFPHFLLRWLLGGEGFVLSIAAAFGLTALAWASGFGLAALVCIPGWLKDKTKKNLRPLTFGFALFFSLVILVDQYLRPLAQSENYGFVAAVLSGVAVACGGMLFVYLLAFPSLPWQWRRSASYFSFFLGVALGVAQFHAGYEPDRQAAHFNVFKEASAPSRFVAGKPVSPGEFASEIRKRDQNFLNSHQASEEAQQEVEQD